MLILIANTNICRVVIFGGVVIGGNCVRGIVRVFAINIVYTGIVDVRSGGSESKRSR